MSALATRHWSAAARFVFRCRALSPGSSSEFRTIVSPASFSMLLKPVIGAPLLSHLQNRIWITRVASELVCLPVLPALVLHARQGTHLEFVFFSLRDGLYHRDTRASLHDASVAVVGEDLCIPSPAR